MDAKLLRSISSQVFRRFPEVKGSQPKVKSQNSGQAGSAPTYLIIYQGRAATADGRSIQRIVRVVASCEGKILKITTSR